MTWGRHPSLSLTNCVIDIPVFSVLVITVDAIPSHMIHAITSVDVIRGGYITSCIFGDVSWLLLCGIHVYAYGIHVRHCSPLALFFLTFCSDFFVVDGFPISMDPCISVLPDVTLLHMYLDCMYVQVDLHVTGKGKSFGHVSKLRYSYSKWFML